jgi:hypothetical protein
MINDETLELLSAYLDGALPEAERSALEARLAASADLRRELEELRSVSLSIKDLPKEPLPAGFLARLQARRARGDKPRQDWVFLPPAARPLVAAMSIGVIALTIWNKVVVEPPLTVIHPDVAAKIENAENAPVSQFDVSARAAGRASPPIDSLNKAAGADSLTVAGPVGESVRRGDVLPRLDAAEPAPAAAPAAPASAGLQAMSGKSSARAAGRPYGNALAGGGGADAEPRLRDRTRATMTEEERSARNEEMFGFIEKEKQKMGIAKVLPKDSLAVAARGAGLGGALADRGAAAPSIKAPVPTMLKKIAREGPAQADAVLGERGDASGRLAPDAGLVFSDARSLASSWILLGFPGNPPVTDFSAGRLVLIKPSATKIVSVDSGPDAVRVVFRSLDQDEPSDPAKDRVAPIPAEPRTVLIFDASPR